MPRLGDMSPLCNERRSDNDQAIEGMTQALRSSVDCYLGPPIWRSLM